MSMKLNINKKMRAVVMAASVGLVAVPAIVVSTTAQANVPVFDASAFARQLEMLIQAKQQYDQAKATYQQFRGSRDVGVLFNQYGQYLPQEMQAMYRDYQNKNWAGLSDKIAQLEKSNKLTGTQKQQLQKLAQDAKLATFGNKVMLQEMFEKNNQRFNQLQRMANSIDLQNDPKAAADLMNRIQVETAMLQLQSNQIQMMNMLRQAEKEVQKERAIERARKFNSSQNTQRIEYKSVFK